MKILASEIADIRSQLSLLSNNHQIDGALQLLLYRALDCAQLKHQPKLRRWLAECEKKSDRLPQRLLVLLEKSLAVTQSRCSQSIKIDYPEALPICTALEAIREQLDLHQVVIVAGETGSGKTTQLPKLCLSLHRGTRGQIGHTQPRRLAARTVAARVAEELNVGLGEAVGYQFRFDDQSQPHTRCKVMTDGILLSEIRNDKLLLNYDTLIIDEAHERSLNIDFLLGYIKTILPRRPDLKLIVTSATIDVERFADYFEGAPVITVEGRSFPVEHVYLPLENDNGEGLSIAQGIEQALDNIESIQSNEISHARDVLVFLPGEREIRDISQLLRKTQTTYEVLPLYARLSKAEQQRVFSPSVGGQKRRVILATNVAETSVTVPGIGYVIDSGLARVSRYSSRSRIQRLVVEPVSQASAMQRAGRCGRIAPGICFRLFPQSDYQQRSEYTEPEILRTRLASVILQMKYLGLGQVDSFPFIDTPEKKQINGGIKALLDIGAIDAAHELTAIGRQLAVLPVDPAQGRMLLAAQKERCLAEMLVVVSALAVQDPREAPADARESAEQKHRRFWHPQSDFLAWLNLWLFFEEKREQLSQSALRKLCRRESLSYMRMREWRDMHRQLLRSLQQLGVRIEWNLQYPLAIEDTDNQQSQNHGQQATGSLGRRYPASTYAALHRAIIAGLPLQCGSRIEPDRSNQSRSAKRNSRAYEYRGCSGARFSIFPGSSQFKKPPKWIVVAEIAQTQKVYGRCVAAIEPEWIESSLPQLIKHHYTEPYWNARRGQVAAKRSSTLYGLPIVSDQPTWYEKIDPHASRCCFIREALVARRLNPDKRLEKFASFYRHNDRVVRKLAELEARLRERRYVPDDDVLYGFYDRRLPSTILSRQALYECYRKSNDAGRKLNDSLSLIYEDLADSTALDNAEEQFPGHIDLAGNHLTLRYQFAPGADEDGVTVLVPLSVLSGLPVNGFDWLVPGLIEDKVLEMLRLLPKAQRKQLVPLPAAATRLLDSIDIPGSKAENKSLVMALAEKLAIYFDVRPDTRSWQADCEEKLASIYTMHIEVIDVRGNKLSQGDNPHQLQRDMHGEIAQVVERSQSQEKRDQRYVSWSFGQRLLGQRVTVDQTGVSGYPALRDEGDAVSLTMAVSAAEAQALSRGALLRLAMLELSDKVRYLKKQLKRMTLPVLPYVSIGQHDELIEDMIMAGLAHACFDEFSGPLPVDKAAFDVCIKTGSSSVISAVSEVEVLVHTIMKEYQHCCELIQKRRVHFAKQCNDIEQQLRDLLYPRFVSQTGITQLKHYPRFINAIAIRLDRLGGNVKVDDDYCEKLSVLRQRWQDLLYKYPHAFNSDSELIRYRWLIEELRVSLFAQQLKTSVPVSFQRVEKAWQKIDRTQYPLAK